MILLIKMKGCDIIMTNEEYEEKVHITKMFCFFIGGLILIGLFINIYRHNYTNGIFALVFLVLLYFFYYLTKKRNICGPIIGIILGILYILQFNIITIIIGICTLIDCILMLKYIKDTK